MLPPFSSPGHPPTHPLIDLIPQPVLPIQSSKYISSLLSPRHLPPNHLVKSARPLIPRHHQDKLNTHTSSSPLGGRIKCVGREPQILTVLDIRGGNPVIKNDNHYLTRQIKDSVTCNLPCSCSEDIPKHHADHQSADRTRFSNPPASSHAAPPKMVFC